tara:strand:+ start:1839 stop:2351 length:513 start_codon:yes stop_codon:yes gene_type:complete
MNKERFIKNFLIVFSVLFVVVALFFLTQMSLTGKVGLEIEDNVLTIGIKSGELIPKKSVFIINYENETEELKFKEFIKLSDFDLKSKKDNYYVENVEISEEGQGYGVEGENEIGEKGFGKDYLGEDITKISLDLILLNLSNVQSVFFKYGDIVIVSSEDENVDDEEEEES